jgi:hypothetical protein
MPWAMTPRQAATRQKAETESAAYLAAVPTAVRSLVDEMFPEISDKDNAAANVVLDQLVSEATTPGRFTTLAWRDIISSRRIDWQSGIVARGSSRFTPLFSRAEVLALFNIQPPTPRPLGGKESLEKVVNWYLKVWIPNCADQRSPGRNEDVQAGKAQLGNWVTKDLIDHVRRDPRVKPYLNPRGRPNKLPKI